MSVINKMLRDLDARRAYAPGLPREFVMRVSAGRNGHTLLLPQLERPHKAYWIAAVGLVLVAAGMGYFASNYYVLQEKSPPAPRSFVLITADPNLELPKVVPVVVAAPTVSAPKPPVPTVAVPTAVPQAAPALAAVVRGAFPGPGIPALKVDPVKSSVTVLSPQIASAQPVTAKGPVPALAAPAQIPEPAKAVGVAPATSLVAKPTVPVQPAPAMPAPKTMPTQTPAPAPAAKLPVPAQAAPAPQPVAARPAIAPTSTTPPASATATAPIAKQIAAQTPTPVPTQTLANAPQVMANSPAKVQSPPVAAPQPNRQAAAQETLAQAQSLWNAGSHDAATDLMREAVAMTERAYNAGSLPADSPVLASLVRELARMELAEGRSLRVVELLTRLEPALSGQADLWAVRGNAAQRLSRHQESVKAYSRALAIRPDEPRWMLASAVSLAALGQLEESAELVDKAHAAGVVSPDILSYLKQIGVPIKPR